MDVEGGTKESFPSYGSTPIDYHILVVFAESLRTSIEYLEFTAAVEDHMVL